MNHRLARTAIIAAATLIAGAALSGCAPTAHPSAGRTHHAGNGHPTSSSTPSATPTATSTPTAAPFPQSLGALPATALFRITAKGIQPNGATIDLVETVFAPVPATASETSLLNAQCNFSGSPNWTAQFPGGALDVDMTATATIDTTTPAFNTNASIAADFEDFSAAAFSGNFLEAQAPCAPGFIKLPGTLHGVGAVLKSSPAHGSFGWASTDARYGFFGDGNDPSDPNGGGGNTIVKDCAVQLSAAALSAAPALTAWEAQPYVQSKSCYYTP